MIATIVIVVVSIVLLCTGVGAVLAGACWGAILGAVIGGVSGGLDSMANGSTFLEGFEDGALSGAVSGAISGAAFAGLGQLGMAAGKGLNALSKGAACVTKLGKLVKGTAAVTKVMSTIMGGFDTIALADKAFGSGNIAALNAKLHANPAYNIFQTGVAAVAAFTGGVTSTMKCFVAGTLVLTASGLVAIENIKAGDIVVSTNTETMETANKMVLETYVREAVELIHLTIDGDEIITTTDHPFYVIEKGFVNAGSLWIGTELLDPTGKIIKIDDIYRGSTDGDSVKVYNFQVEEYHTYYVGKWGLLVHNAGNAYQTKTVDTIKGKEEIPRTGKPGSPSWEQAVKDIKNARGKGNNFIAENLEQAEQLINEAKPELPKCNKYSPDAPKSNYQIHEIDNEYNMPHIKFADWKNGKHNGCDGHIFWEE